MSCNKTLSYLRANSVLRHAPNLALLLILVCHYPWQRLSSQHKAAMIYLYQLFCLFAKCSFLRLCGIPGTNNFKSSINMVLIVIPGFLIISLLSGWAKMYKGTGKVVMVRNRDMKRLLGFSLGAAVGCRITESWKIGANADGYCMSSVEVPTWR